MVGSSPIALITITILAKSLGIVRLGGFTPLPKKFAKSSGSFRRYPMSERESLPGGFHLPVDGSSPAAIIPRAAQPEFSKPHIAPVTSCVPFKKSSAELISAV